MKISFQKPISPLVAVILWVFITAYVIDAANLDDLLPGNLVLHPEASEPGYADTPDYVASVAILDLGIPFPPAQASRPALPPKLRIVIDQDSPSLAAEPLITLISTARFVEEQKLTIESHRASSSLYLRNCTLLI